MPGRFLWIFTCPSRIRSRPIIERWTNHTPDQVIHRDMSKSTPQAPPAPDPSLVTQQQTGANLNAAIAQRLMNDTNQYSPFGSTTYQQTGTQNVGGFEIPTYSQTTTFNPTVQSIISGTENVGASLVPTGQALANEIGSSATKPLNFSGVNQDYLNSGPQLLDQNASNAVYQQQKSFLDPQWQQSQKDLEDQLSRQGIPIGSDAYNSAISNFQNQKTQAYQSAQDSAIAQGAQNAGQLFNQALAGQQQNISQQQLAQMSPIELLSMLYNTGAN